MYSQNREEKIIIDYFKDYIGTFLSIGENDGITLSNVRRLAEFQWKGVMVEPSPKAFARLKENYKEFDGIYCYPFALGTKNNPNATLKESGPLLGTDDVGLLSTFHDSEIKRWNGKIQYKEVKVKCFKWKTFLNRLTIKKFDFINIDAEGEDMNILKQIDLTDVKMVCVEWNGKQKEEFTEVCRGFRLIHQNAENLIFAR